MYFLRVNVVVLAVIIAVRTCRAFVRVDLPVRSSSRTCSRRTGPVSAIGGVPSNAARCSRPASVNCWQQRVQRQRPCGFRLSMEETPSEVPGLPGLPSLPGMTTVVETEEEEEQRNIREWQDDGRKGRVLVRRREMPLPEHTPAEACRIVFQSLQNNDDPMLDYGAAVAIKFASSLNAVSKMTPADYGAFLRNDPEYTLLLENSSCRPIAKAKASADGKQMLQAIELVGTYPEVTKRVVEVQLSMEDDSWKIDAITFVPL